MSAHPLVTCDVHLTAKLLAEGGLAGMPTETVYGLAADATNIPAVARVFAVKGRPADHPLIVHLAEAEDLDGWACDVPEYARQLADRFWPGPLTLVLPRTGQAGDHVTGGQPTVGLRVPSHPVARELLIAYGQALAAPSANRFGRVSPTTAAHVVQELATLLVPGRDIVLDGGPSTVGVESAIVDCTGPAPVILRPGAITAEDVNRIGGVPVVERTSPVRAPGTLTSHYAPRATVELADDDAELAALLASRPERNGSDDTSGGEGTTWDTPGDTPITGLLALAAVTTPPRMVRLSEPPDAAGYARVLYSALREADALGLRRVLAVMPPPDGLGAAVRDRLRRAAAAG